MHPNNPHNSPYNFKTLCKVNPALKPFVFKNNYGNTTLAFQDQKAVFELNKALLLHHYKLDDYQLPTSYLSPAVPGRMDYLCYIKDILKAKGRTSNIRGLDIGTGANGIYTLLGVQHFNWHMIGADIDANAIAVANNNLRLTSNWSQTIEFRLQENKQNILVGVLQPEEKIDFTVCNPPFYSSEEEANKTAFNKLKNLFPETSLKELQRNFSGSSNELWCNGGELLFIKRMIKQSALVKNQIGFFSTLVSKKEHLNTFYKLLTKQKATHQTLKMEQGNKVSHLLTWEF